MTMWRGTGVMQQGLFRRWSRQDIISCWCHLIINPMSKANFFVVRGVYINIKSTINVKLMSNEPKSNFQNKTSVLCWHQCPMWCNKIKIKKKNPIHNSVKDIYWSAPIQSMKFTMITFNYYSLIICTKKIKQNKLKCIIYIKRKRN